MNYVILGAGGFLGKRIVSQLLTRDDVGQVIALDIQDFASPADPRVHKVIGSLENKALREDVLLQADKVMVLASILGGTAEANYPLARRINVDSTLDVFECLTGRPAAVRVVFASTIAVFAKPMPEVVTDQTPTGPTMIYGAQKLMMEIALSNFTRRGQLDGVSLRPAGIMANELADTRLRSAFMNRVFYAFRDGFDLELPVYPESTTWLSSVRSVADNFIHAANLPTADLGDDRAFTLPALYLSFQDLVDALRQRFPDSKASITFAPDAELAKLFGSYVPLETAIANRLNFSRDATATELVERAFD